MKNLIYIYSLLFLLISCEKTTTADTEVRFAEMSEQDDLGLAWLQSIFKCQDSNELCIPHNEEEVFSEQYWSFLLQGWELEHSYLGEGEENEKVQAEKNFKEKWNEIYPKLVGNGETMPFGRGNGGVLELTDLKIEPLGNLEYQIYTQYHEKFATNNKVRLIPHDGSFLIDYIETEYVNESEGITQNSTDGSYNFTQEWKWTYINNHEDEMEFGHKGDFSAYYNPQTKYWLFTKDAYERTGDMVNWVLGKPDGTYVFSFMGEFQGEEPTYDVMQTEVHPQPKTLNEFYKSTGKSAIFNDNNWGFDKIKGQEYKRTYMKTNDFNLVYLADYDADFTALYYFNELGSETYFPVHFDIDLPKNKAVLSDKTTVAGKDVRLDFVGIKAVNHSIDYKGN